MNSFWSLRGGGLEQKPEHEKAYHTALSLICPMTRLLMVDPVIISNGDTYERSALESCFRFGDANILAGYCDPITRVRLSDTTILPNNSIKRSIEQFVAMYEDKEGDEWKPVLELCEDYRTKIG